MIRAFGRPAFGAPACFCVFFMGLGSAGAEELHLRLGKATGISFSQAPADVGVQEGIFKKNGPTSNSAALAAAEASFKRC